MAIDPDESFLHVIREAVERRQHQPHPVSEPPAMRYTDLPEQPPDSPLYREWNTYRREVGRLLAEGHEGKFALIHGNDVIGIFADEEAAFEVGYGMHLLQRPFMVQPIREREPLLRFRGYALPCRS